MTFRTSTQLRAAFAQRMAGIYGREVPAYTTLVEVSAAVNADVLHRDGAAAERLGSLARVTAERHGAIRVGTPEELRQVSRVFAAMGMSPVGYYDLRDAARSAVPVVSTAFRPTEAGELAANPFRMFTSLLVPDDRRFFDADLRRRVETFLARRTLFPPELLELAERAVADGGLDPDGALKFLQLATASFTLSEEPVDRTWYAELEAVSSVAADIGGVSSTHINHLTPRVLDIDELYRRMTERGLTMIDAIQGPPRWEGPDVLLRQTSFRALAEPRRFREADGTVSEGSLRVRFGEVEARGIALTAAGRDRYDLLLTEVDRRAASSPGAARQDVAAQVWREWLPSSELGLLQEGLAFFTFAPGPSFSAFSRAPGSARHPTSGHLAVEWPTRSGHSSPKWPLAMGAEPGAGGERAAGRELGELVSAGILTAMPIVYEDFLPRSAAGIFQSNLTGDGRKDAGAGGAVRDAGWLSDVIGREVADPIALYAAQQRASLTALGVQDTSLRAADSMSSSDSRTSEAAVPSGT